MYTAFDEVQKEKQQGSYLRRLSSSRPALGVLEDGQDGHATKHEQEDDLRIMQHFARDFIERSKEMDSL